MEDASGAGSRSESSARTTVNDCSRSKESLAAPMTGRKARDGHGNEEAEYARADRWESSCLVLQKVVGGVVVSSGGQWCQLETRHASHSARQVSYSHVTEEYILSYLVAMNRNQSNPIALVPYIAAIPAFVHLLRQTAPLESHPVTVPAAAHARYSGCDGTRKGRMHNHAIGAVYPSAQANRSSAW